MAYVGAGQNKYTVFPLENYTFGHKSPKVEKQRNLEARFKHLKDKYAEEGMRRTAEGILLVHQHNTIHALLLQPNPSFFRLPGGKLKPGEDEISGLQRKLTRHLGPTKSEDLQMKWQVADCLGTFYRPNFETQIYPYCPTHIERPKETKKLFLVNLPEKAFLTVPRNFKLIAVPLFELYDHASKYGPVISAIPTLLSRLQFTLAQANSSTAAVPSPMPMSAAPQLPQEPPAAPPQQQHGAYAPQMGAQAGGARPPPAPPQPGMGGPGGPGMPGGRPMGHPTGGMQMGGMGGPPGGGYPPQQQMAHGGPGGMGRPMY